MIVLFKNCYAIAFIFVLLWLPKEIKAQNILGKKVTLAVHQRKLGEVLAILEQQGNFRFSYNSTILPLDSLVDINAINLSIEETLNVVLKQRYEYRQAYDFLIVRYAPLKLTLLVQESYGDQNLYVITGKVVDEQSRKPLANVSVYEKNLLQSTLTNQDGLFTLKLKNISQTVAVTFSKLNYKDATSFFLPEITIYKSERKNSNRYIANTPSAVEKTFLGRVFITSKQKTQSTNIGGFIANAPAQLSIGPGLSSHGSLSGQVINKFSFNATGDYHAGVDGMEVGLLFNIDKKDVRYFQFGGAFNLVGGEVNGVQIASFYNYTLENYKGLQISVGYNRVGGEFKGVQIGGLFNNLQQDLKGVQISIGHNLVKKSLSGLQIGGLYNRVINHFNGTQISLGYNQTATKFRGLQFGGLFNNIGRDLNGLQFSLGYNRTKSKVTGWQIGSVNYTKTLKGVQFGLVNVADSSSGYSIGLLNLVKKGYHKISIGTNESIDFNAALKTGNHKLYTQLLFGKNFNAQQQLIALGLGLGKDIKIGKNVSLNPEISSRYVYQGDWKYKNILNRLELNIGYRLTKWAAINAGPALNFYYTTQDRQISNYDFIGARSNSAQTNKRYQGWLGWNLGITLF